jgi:hypothetical protein
MKAFSQAGGAGGALAVGAALTAYGISAGASANLNPAAAAAIHLTYSYAMQVNRAATANLPKGYKNVLIRCWGNQRTPRPTLLGYAMRVAFTRMGPPSLAITSSKEMLITQDSENFVSVSYTVNWGLDAIANAVGGAGPLGALVIESLPTAEWTVEGAPIGGFTFFRASLARNSETVVNMPVVGNVTHTQSLLTNPPFPSDGGTRGTAAMGPSSVTLQTLITQTLEGFEQQPGVPP